MQTQRLGLAAGARSLLLLYSRPKRGKTTAFVRALCGGVLIGQRRAISDVAVSGSHMDPASLWIVDEVTTIDGGPMVAGGSPSGLIHFLQWCLGPGLAEVQKRRVIYIDDTNLLFDRNMPIWGAEAPKNKFHKYDRLNNALLKVANLADDLARAGVMVCLSMHEHPPEHKENEVGEPGQPGYQRNVVFYPGSPEIPSRNQLDKLPAWSDRVVRLSQSDAYPDPWWSIVFHCDPQDSQWITGDRINQIRNGDPANLRELLRLDGIELPRPPGLEFLDTIAEEAAVSLATGAFTLTETQATATALFGKYGQVDPLHLTWAVQDGVARAAFRRSRAAGPLGRMRQIPRTGPPGLVPPPK